MGVAAVLFVGLAIGALNPGLSAGNLPEKVFLLGLVIFVYNIECRYWGINYGFPSGFHQSNGMYPMEFMMKMRL